MQFDTKPQQEIYERVLPWVTELFGGSVLRKPDSPVIGVMYGSAFAQIGIFPWGEHDAVITTRSYVVTDVQLTPELMHYLLHELRGVWNR
jgi:hypothetical protein